MRECDYIIVGAGAAGCALAARLSEAADCSVLLLEAGPPDRNPYIHMPAGFAKMTGGPLTWGWRTVAQRHAANREILFAQGRVLGGGSSINAMVFTRGCPEDYDRWAHDEGCPGWSATEVQPYFLRMEDNDLLSGSRHGVGGPLGVSSIPPNRMTRAFVQACQQYGIPHTPDFNGASQAGCGVYQTTTRDGRRCSSAVAYLRAAMVRPNLSVLTNCLSTRLVIEDGRAVGVEYRQSGGLRVARAAREVIVAAGAIGSPRLLLLSGIGPADELRALGIDVVLDLPAVGRDLQDHYGTDVVYELGGPYSLDKYNKPHWMLWAGLEYKLFGKGPVASNIVEGGAFWWSDRNSPTPDTQFHFLSGAGVEAGIPAPESGSGCTMNTYFLRPRSRGSVTLRTGDPAAAPAIDPNYLADPYDVLQSVRGVKMMRDIMRQTAFASTVTREHVPGAALQSDAEIEEYIRQRGRTSYHPVGTCRMGGDAASVVDPELRVRGIERLRICDSSIMPSLVSSNTNAPSIMIGEKAADLIRGNAAREIPV